jgi:NADH:ubiquinone oxidoreductase subunit C
MLDYSFEGYPLLKQFSSCGYEELEYDIFERWLVYKPLKNRDNLEI